MKKPRSAIIIGGGIAGPALALFLKRAGIDAQVFEAYPRAEDVGGGFQIAPNGMRVLEALGLAAAVNAAGSSAGAFTFRNHRGRVLASICPDRAGKAVTTMRAPFYRTQHDALERENIAVHYAKRLSEVSYQADAVIAHFADGTSARADFLVGADGVHSRVRALVLPAHAEPRYTGMLGIGGLAGPSATLPSDAVDARSLNFILGPRLSFGYAKMGTTQQDWGWWCHLPQDPELPAKQLRALPPEVLRERLAAAFSGWSAPVSSFIASTETIIRTAIYEVPSLPTWSQDRVVLIGDAAHAMSPAAGQGASLALEDAQLLSHLLRDPSQPLEQTFKHFEQRRKPRTTSIAATARSNDDRALQQLGPVAYWLRDHMFPLFAPLVSRGLEKEYSAAVL